MVRETTSATRVYRVLYFLLREVPDEDEEDDEDDEGVVNRIATVRAANEDAAWDLVIRKHPSAQKADAGDLGPIREHVGAGFDPDGPSRILRDVNDEDDDP